MQMSSQSSHHSICFTYLFSLCSLLFALFLTHSARSLTAFDPALLARWSFADWIEGRTGLYWPSCLQEMAHTLNAADHWQPLLRAFDARVQPYIEKAMAAVSATAEAAAEAEKTQVLYPFRVEGRMTEYMKSGKIGCGNSYCDLQKTFSFAENEV
jgi:hypothetical protein